jgi:hypothetical protein
MTCRARSEFRDSQDFHHRGRFDFDGLSANLRHGLDLHQTTYESPGSPKLPSASRVSALSK